VRCADCVLWATGGDGGEEGDDRRSQRRSPRRAAGTIDRDASGRAGPHDELRLGGARPPAADPWHQRRARRARHDTDRGDPGAWPGDPADALQRGRRGRRCRARCGARRRARQQLIDSALAWRRQI